MEDNVYQTTTSTHGPHGVFFLDSMVFHNIVLQAVAITNKPTLKEIFPNYKATGTVTIPTSNVTILYTTPVTEETLASKLCNLERRMPKLLNAALTLTNGVPLMIGTGADCNSGKSLIPPPLQY